MLALIYPNFHYVDLGGVPTESSDDFLKWVSERERGVSARQGFRADRTTTQFFVAYRTGGCDRLRRAVFQD